MQPADTLDNCQPRLHRPSTTPGCRAPGAGGGVGGPMGVYVLRDGRAWLRPVVVGARNERDAWMRAGLAPGETVLIYLCAALRDGARVALRSVEQPR